MESVSALENADTSPVRRALALHVVVQQSLLHAANDRHWGALYVPIPPANKWTGEEVAPLAERLKNVRLENRDALEVLERISIRKDAVVYCDPPYRDVCVKPYGKGKDGTDWKRMEELLKAQQGKCAISGYGKEWDALGWNRFEINKYFSAISGKGKRATQRRTEVLWCNFEVENRQQRFEL